MALNELLLSNPKRWLNIKSESIVNGEDQVLGNTEIVITSTTPVNISAQDLVASLIHCAGLSPAAIYNLPSTESVYSFLNARYGVPNRPPQGFSFIFKLVNNSAFAANISSISNPQWQLNYSADSTATNILVASGTTREFTFIYGIFGPDTWAVAG